MPSPFKRHSASRQIRPMSAAELQASLEETEAKAEDDKQLAWYITRNPQGGKPDNWSVKFTADRFPETELNEWTHDEAESTARDFAERTKYPYLGER